MMPLKLQELSRAAGCDFGHTIGWDLIWMGALQRPPISKVAWRESLGFCKGKSNAHVCTHVFPY